MDRASLADRIKSLRKALGLNQATVAAETGVSERLLSDLENGKGNPSIGAVEALEDRFKEPLLSVAVEPLLLRPSQDSLAQLINAPGGVAHSVVSAVLARLLNENSEVRAAVLAVLYGDSTITHLDTSAGKTSSQ